MHKRALLMTAATVALLSGRASAADAVTGCDTTNTTDYTSITTAVKVPLCTNTENKGHPGDITVTSTGSVIISNATTPVIMVNSSVVGSDVNNLITQASSTITNKDTAGGVGIEIQTSTTNTTTGVTTPVTITGGLDLSGAMNMIGTGDSKRGVYLQGSGTFVGNITVESGATIQVNGNSGAAILTDVGSTLHGNMTIAGSLTAGAAATSSSSTPSAVTNPEAIFIGGNLSGNFDIAATGIVTAIGTSSEGVVVGGDIGGSFTNEGSINSIGTSTPKGTNDPIAGPAVILAGDIGGGIYNAGPANNTATTTATITTGGTAPALLIEPGASGAAAASNSTIGTYADTVLGSTYSLVNRGGILSQPGDANRNSIGAEISGITGFTVQLAGGIYNAGGITASSTNTAATSGTATVATGLWIAGGVNIGGNGTLWNDNAGTSVAAGTNGVISASLSGPRGGTAAALLIGVSGNGNPTSLPVLINSGTISAQVTTTETKLLSNTTTTPFGAVAIRDFTGTLHSISNSGIIEALATKLDDNSQTAIAVDVSQNTTGVNFNNTGIVQGDIDFGDGSDLLTVGGGTNNSTSQALVSGNINFNGGNDNLIVNNYATVSGIVTKTAGVGTLNVTVAPAGNLYLRNVDAGLVANNFDAEGTLGLTLSQSLINTIPIVKATNLLTVGTNANLILAVGTALDETSASNFILLQAPNGKLTVADPGVINADIQNAIPFLFNGSVCSNGVAGFTACTGSAATSANAQLVLGLVPKTAADIGLTGYAAKMFGPVNAALVHDDTLGAAVIQAGLPSNMIPNSDPALYAAEGKQLYQGIYDQFAPDVTGASRAIAVALTDQVTGPVGARQRALRMYANQPAQATLWGQEFAERINENSTTPDGQFRDSGFGFALGIDGGDPRNGRYGAAFTFYSGDVTEKQPRLTKNSTLWYMLSGYSDWRGKGFFFDSQLSVGLGDFAGKRAIRIVEPVTGTTLLTRTAEGDRTGLLGAGGVSTGVILTAGTTVLTPQISLDGLTMREDSYTETGGGGACTTATNVRCDAFDLKVNPSYMNSLRGYVGASLREDLNFGSFFVQPELRGGYRYDFLNDPETVKASFVSTPSNVFSLTGPDPGKGNLVGGFSLGVTTDAWTIGVNYDYLRSSQGSVSQAGTLTLMGRI